MSLAEAAELRPVYQSVIDSIDQMNWEGLTSNDIMRVAKAYYYFSVQFRENLETACALYPSDKLLDLWYDECATPNLSPWPMVAERDERMDHDEFMRRLLQLHAIGSDEALTRAGEAYLTKVRKIDDRVRAASIASYEDGGLYTVFTAMLRCRNWEGRGQRAFRFFLRAHVGFDSGEGGHGSLCNHLAVDDSILPLWMAFRDLLVYACPRLTA